MPGKEKCGICFLGFSVNPFIFRIIFYMLTTFSTFPLHAEGITFAPIPQEQKLSQSTVKCIIQDNKGFIWFGTQDGLNKYDGYRFSVYRPETGNPLSISNNHINCMLIDKNGTLWIGTRYGVNIFDTKTETFFHFVNNPEKPSSLSQNTIQCLCEDSYGEIWIGTRNGLNKLERETKKFVKIGDNSVTSICEDHTGKLWVGTNQNGLYKLDLKEKSLIHQNFPGKTINSIYEDQSGLIWIGTTEKGLFRITPESISGNNIYTHYPVDSNSINSSSNRHITSIFQDRSGMLWIGTLGGGLYRWDGHQFSNYRSNPGHPKSLIHNMVLSIYEDRFNVLWIGTWNGVCKHDRERKPFKHVNVETEKHKGLNSNAVHALYEDKQGIIWIGTDDKGLNRFDPKTRRFSYYQAEPGDPSSLAHNSIRVLFEDSLNRFWIGTRGGGLDLMDRKNLRFTHHLAHPTETGSLTCNYINAIVEDHLGTLWIGTYGGGINYLEMQENPNKFLHLQAPPPGIPSNRKNQYLSSDLVQVIFLDRKGALWIGTDGGGLNHFHPQHSSPALQHFYNQPHNPNSLSSNCILSIYENRQGIIWIGTDGGGLDKYDPERKTFTHYNTSHLLANNVVYGILEDYDGNLWLSTNNGLSHFDPVTQTFKNYTTSDGLQSNEFNANAYYKTKNGHMLFGGNNGFNSFNPADIKDNPYIPPIVITNLKIFNQSISPRQKIYGHEILKNHITHTHSIKLTHNENIFSLEFAALHYTAPEKNRYTYKMEGLEDNWNKITNQRSVSYANIPPGFYTFRVKGSNNDGVWNEQGTTLQITISPSFEVFVIFRFF